MQTAILTVLVIYTVLKAMKDSSRRKKEYRKNLVEVSFYKVIKKRITENAKRFLYLEDELDSLHISFQKLIKDLHKEFAAVQKKTGYTPVSKNITPKRKPGRPLGSKSKKRKKITGQALKNMQEGQRKRWAKARANKNK